MPYISVARSYVPFVLVWRINVLLRFKFLYFTLKHQQIMTSRWRNLSPSSNSLSSFLTTRETHGTVESRVSFMQLMISLCDFEYESSTWTTRPWQR